MIGEDFYMRKEKVNGLPRLWTSEVVEVFGAVECFQHIIFFSFFNLYPA